MAESQAHFLSASQTLLKLLVFTLFLSSDVMDSKVK